MSDSQDLSHHEIWDDSALVDSWNEAVEEYKYYHGMHARGEKVEDVLREVDEKGMQAVVEQTAPADVMMSETNGTYDTEAAQEIANTESTPRINVQASETQQPNGSTTVAPSATVPQVLLGGVQDEGLKSLMMSWYYAGYYTGLHEGQQQGRQQG